MSFIVCCATGDEREFIAVNGTVAPSLSASLLGLSRFFLSSAALLLVSTLSTAADASLVGVNIFGNTVYTQTSAAAPTNPSFYFFSIGGDYASGDTFGGATAIFPGTASPVTSFENNVPQPNFFNNDSVEFPSLSVLHTAYNFGTYTITATVNGSPNTGVINNYTQDLFTSSIPFLTNYDGLQGLNPTNAVTATYNAYTPANGTNESFTFFTIRNATTGVDVYSQNFLPSTTTSSTVPADTLMPDTQYDFEVDYTNRIDGIDSIHSVGTTQGFDVRVEATVTTGSRTSVPEPGSLFLLGTALVGFGASCRHRTRAQRKPA
jgi:PEP-CTERM motif